MTDLRAIVPEGMAAYVDDWKMSPGLACSGFVFLTGMTAAGEGRVDPDPRAQIESVFAKVDLVLRQAGLDFSAVVDRRVRHRSGDRRTSRDCKES